MKEQKSNKEEIKVSTIEDILESLNSDKIKDPKWGKGFMEFGGILDHDESLEKK